MLLLGVKITAYWYLWVARVPGHCLQSSLWVTFGRNPLSLGIDFYLMTQSDIVALFEPICGIGGHIFSSKSIVFSLNISLPNVLMPWAELTRRWNTQYIFYVMQIYDFNFVFLNQTIKSQLTQIYPISPQPSQF